MTQLRLTLGQQRSFRKFPLDIRHNLTGFLLQKEMFDKLFY